MEHLLKMNPKWCLPKYFIRTTNSTFNETLSITLGVLPVPVPYFNQSMVASTHSWKIWLVGTWDGPGAMKHQFGETHCHL